MATSLAISGFDKTDPVEKAIIDEWKTADHPDMPIGSDQHDISVRIGGHEFDSVRRRMITRRVAGKDLLQIQWLK